MPLDQFTDNENFYDEDFSDTGKEMSFLDHLEELRWHIIRSVGSIAVFGIIAFVFHGWIFRHIILAPKYTDFWTYRMMCKLEDLGLEGFCVDKLDFELRARELTEQFTMAMTVSLIIGLLCAFPYAFWEIWRFIKPGLRKKEVEAARGAVFWVTLLFMLGVLFGYYVVTPLAIQFLANFKVDESIVNQFDISSFISLEAMLALGCGVTFQLPVITFVLSKVGLITPKFMKEYRRHALVVILIVAAVITPSPDISSQLLVAAPLTLLYEISIGVSARVEKQRLKEMEA
jgi:sec-independent protein translocase protein TatC